MHRLVRILAAVVLMAGTTTLVAASPSGATGGMWAPVPTPTSGGGDVYPADVSCASAVDCMAVGTMSGSVFNETWAMRWDGSDWLPVAMPEAGAGNNFAASVSCVSSSFCVAAGYFYSGTRFETMTQHWNGTAWSIVPSPNDGAGNNQLTGVSCTSTTHCVAVGQRMSTVYVPLALVWDGTAWTSAVIPAQGSLANYLNDVDCVSATECMAVGSYSSGVGATSTLALLWNGTVWTLAPSPVFYMSTTARFRGVSCFAASGCVAVGDADPSGLVSNLAARWDGSSWTIDPALSGFSLTSPRLYRVSCLSSSECVAGGRGSNSSAYAGTIFEWDGSTWTETVVVSDPIESAEILGVACVQSDVCTAVGYQTTNQVAGALSLWLTPATPPSTPPVVPPAYTG